MRDPDLTDLFRAATNEDLDPVVEYLLGASTNELDIDPRFKLHRPNHAKYIDAIVKDIRLFGGSTIVNVLRGDGVPYLEIAGDVCDKVGARRSGGEDAEALELKIIEKLFADSLEKMDAAERAALEAEIKAAGSEHSDLSAVAPTGVIAAQMGVRVAGFAAYKMAAIVANAVAKAVLGRGLTFAGNAALMRALGIAAGPVGWVISAIWTVVDVAGPAYRVTVPVVCHVGFLRQKQALGASKT